MRIAGAGAGRPARQDRRFGGFDGGYDAPDVSAIPDAGPDGSLHACKTLSTPDDYGRGIAQALKRALDDLSLDALAVERIVHATTVATNAILEKKGARVGLVTTRGFRQVLQIAERLQREPQLNGVLNFDLCFFQEVLEHRGVSLGVPAGLVCRQID